MTEINQEKRDRKYNNWARYYPAIVNLTFPLVLVAYLFFDMDVVKSANSDLLKTIELLTKIILVFGCVISALFFLYAVFMRELSINLIEKVIDYIFEKYSVKIMLKENKTFSDDRKKQ